MNISLIVAVAKNGVIGRDGKMPWHLPADLAHFKKITTGHAVIMGRRTFESIGKPLPHRCNIVLSRSSAFAEGLAADIRDAIHIVATPQAAIACAEQAGHDRVFIIGGSEIYRLFEEKADHVVMTQIQKTFDGDTYFQFARPDDWQEIDAREQPITDKNNIAMRFITYARRRAS